MSTVGQQAGELSPEGELGIWTEVKRNNRRLSNLGILSN